MWTENMAGPSPYKTVKPPKHALTIQPTVLFWADGSTVDSVATLLLLGLQNKNVKFDRDGSCIDAFHTDIE